MLPWGHCPVGPSLAAFGGHSRSKHVHVALQGPCIEEETSPWTETLSYPVGLFGSALGSLAGASGALNFVTTLSLASSASATRQRGMLRQFHGPAPVPGRRWALLSFPWGLGCSYRHLLSVTHDVFFAAARVSSPAREGGGGWQRQPPRVASESLRSTYWLQKMLAHGANVSPVCVF